MTTNRIDATPDQLLDAILVRLRTSLGLNERTCFIMLDRGNIAPPPAPDEWFLTVRFDGGNFDTTLLRGGGEHQITVETGVIITIHSTKRLDSGGHDDQILMHRKLDGGGGLVEEQSRGLLVLATRVIRALIDFDPTAGTPDTFAVRELMAPRGFSAPRRLDGETRAAMDVIFDLSFDWAV